MRFGVEAFWGLMVLALQDMRFERPSWEGQLRGPRTYSHR